MPFGIGMILRMALGYIGIHGTYVIIATIIASSIIGMYLKQRFNIGNDKRDRSYGRERRRDRRYERERRGRR